MTSAADPILGRVDAAGTEIETEMEMETGIETGMEQAEGPLPASPAGLPRQVTRHLVSGTSAMGAGAILERGMGFAANILAARFGGASTFGAYSLGITTAANISTYAAGGIGSTAARFSGKYPLGSARYPQLARALGVVSVASAAVAALALWFGAGPLAHILGKASLAPMLRWAAFSAAGMILLECARGFFVGQRRLAALLLLSLAVGLGMVLLVPLAASRHNPAHMILAQAAVTTSAVAVCVLLARPLGMIARAAGPRSTIVPSPAGETSQTVQGTRTVQTLQMTRAATPADASPSRPPAERLPARSVLAEVWGFGMVQLAGLAGMNLAGWWLTTLVARADTTLVQMSFFAIANQMRNIVGLGPSLLTETSYALMATGDRDPAAHLPSHTPDHTPDRTPDQVMALCTFLATASSLVLSAAGVVVVPWALTLLYGPAYRAGAITTAIALAIAIVHMGNSPAAARLTIVSIKTSGVINTVWAVCVGGAGTAVLLGGGQAWEAMAVYLGAHLLSSLLVLVALVRHGAVPPGMRGVLGLGGATSVALAGLAWLRDLGSRLLGPRAQPGWGEHLALACTLAMLAVIATAVCGLWLLGKRYGWLPTAEALRGLARSFARRLTPARSAL